MSFGCGLFLPAVRPAPSTLWAEAWHTVVGSGTQATGHLRVVAGSKAMMGEKAHHRGWKPSTGANSGFLPLSLRDFLQGVSKTFQQAACPRKKEAGSGGRLRGYSPGPSSRCSLEQELSLPGPRPPHPWSRDNEHPASLSPVLPGGPDDHLLPSQIFYQ